MLADLTERLVVDNAAQRFAAIVASSDDAILAKDLKGTITDWNQGAERLFGYTADEVIGKPVAILIPLDRSNEETDILSRIRRGERIYHYETIRRRKDGSLIEISLSVSPIRSRDGRIIGASKIARDITERRRAEEQQQLLIREMDHRVKNLFTLAGSLVTLSARSAATPNALASAVSARLNALSQAHALTVPSTPGATQKITLHALIQKVMAPYDDETSILQPRVTISGPDVAIAGGALTGFALLLHELATNAAKYGSLSVSGGRVDISYVHATDRLIVNWIESGGPVVDRRADGDGFGTVLSNATVRGQLGGEISREWKPDGLAIRLVIARDCLGA